MYTRRQYLNAQALSFLVGILFALSIVFCVATIFVLYFALFIAKIDMLGYVYIQHPEMTEVIARVQKIAEGFTK